MINTRRQVAQRIADRIKRINSTKVHAADAAGISRSTFERAMRGARPFTLEEIEAIADALDMSPLELVPDTWGEGNDDAEHRAAA